MKLILPNYKYKRQYENLISSAIKNKDASELGNAYREGESFNHLLKRLKDRSKGINIAKREVKATIYFIVENEKLVGTIDMRHTLNDDYYSRLGHVAYYIKPEERNKGYATKALALIINKYKKEKINKILITCLKENSASAKVIQKNGGILEKEFLDKITGKIIQRYWIDINLEKIIKPKNVWLTTNRTCNNKCKWCYANTLNFSQKEMDLKNIYKSINFIKENNIKKVILIGGEPTLYKDIELVIKKLHENGIKVSMASNGRNFAEYKFAEKLVNNGLSACNISIKGANEEEYLKNTNSKGFKEMVNGYKNLKKLGIDVSLSYVLCDKNEKNFERFLNSFCQNNLNNLIFQLYKPSVDENFEYNAPTILDIADICKFVYKKMKNTNINFVFEMSIPLCVLDKELLNDMIKNKRITTCCHIAKGKGLIFDTNFDILPCNHFNNHPLNKEKIEFNNIIDFWNSQDVVKFRKIINTYPSEICSRCSKWYICGGGCFIRWLCDKPDNFINNKYEYYEEVKN